MKKSLILFFTFIVFVVPLTAMAIEWGNRPRIEDFSIKQLGGKISFSFSFFNVNGGIENAEFSFITIVFRKNVLVKANSYVVVLNTEDKNHEIINIDGDISKGAFRFEGVIDLLDNLKEGDVIVYYVVLTDSLGRTSNLMRYAFVNDMIDI